MSSEETEVQRRKVLCEFTGQGDDKATCSVWGSLKAEPETRMEGGRLAGKVIPEAGVRRWGEPGKAAYCCGQAELSLAERGPSKTLMEPTSQLTSH